MKHLRWLAAGLALALALDLGCSGMDRHSADLTTESGRAAAEAWSTIYSVLQHPRCTNCHPTDRIPLQGDEGRPHAQNIQAGDDGRGRFGLHCDACHRSSNAGPAPLPPGAPNWRMPTAEVPMVFVGRSAGQLCRQLLDPRQNGGRDREQLLEHLLHDPVVQWGWSPGPGRTPVPVSREDFARAVRAWIENGCGCPD